MALVARQETSNVYPQGASTGAAILTELYILLSLATLLVVIRCYGRIRFTKDWGWDDTSIIFALIFLLIGAILINIEVANGSGTHLADLSDPQGSISALLKYNTFFQMDNVLCALVTKVSISIYILRIKNDRVLRTLLQSLMAFMSLATLAVIIVLSISCIPLKALWTPSIQGEAKCLPLKSVYTVAYVQSGFTIVTDLCLTISPVVVLWNVRIKTWAKVRICFLMSLGLIATISNALRNAFQPALTGDDYTYGLTPITVVAILELSSGIIAACIPAIMPFFRFNKFTRCCYPLSRSMRTQNTHEQSGIESFSLKNHMISEEIHTGSESI